MPGHLPDDDRFISGWLRVDVRVWKRIKCNLIERQKLYVENGLIRNSRADVEVLEALSRVGSARDAGLASARSKAAKSQHKSNEINAKRSTTVPTDVSTPVSTNHNHNHNNTLSTDVDNAAAPPSGDEKPDEKTPDFDLRKVTFDSICAHLTSKGLTEAREAVRRLTGRGELVFPGQRHAHIPLSENAIGYLYNRAGWHRRHVPHGWRAAFSTIMNERAKLAGIADDRAVIDLMLSHVPENKVEGAYNRAEFMPRRREIAREWAGLLLEGMMPAQDLLTVARRSAT